MTDTKELRRLALAAGGDKWEGGDVDGYVFGSDGDSVCLCHANMGKWPDPIYPEHRAEYIAAASPSVVLALLDEVEALRKDAERYRWLRKNAYSRWERGDGTALVVPPARQTVTSLEDYQVTVDRAVDALASPQPEKEEGWTT